MSVDSKMFVTCGKDKLFDVVNEVVKHLNVFVRKELDNYWQTRTDAVSRGHFLRNEDYKAQAELFSNGLRISAHDLDVIPIVFGIGDANLRTLFIFPDCSCDYKDVYKGDKITFSIGCWGRNSEVMEVVGTTLAKFGDVYYDHNDCDGEDFVLLHTYSDKD